MSYATIELLDGSTVLWDAVPQGTGGGTTVGRYQRCSNFIRSRASEVLADLAAANADLATMQVDYDNAPVALPASSGPVVVPVHPPTAITAAVQIKWTGCERQGTASRIDYDEYRFTGVLSISFIASKRDGDGLLTKAIDFVEDATRWLDDADVHFETPRTVNDAPGIQVPQGSFARTVEVPFYVDEDNAKLASTGGNVSAASSDQVGIVTRSRFTTFVSDPSVLAVVFDNLPTITPSGVPRVEVEVLHDGSTSLVTMGVGRGINALPQRYMTGGVVQVTIEVDFGTMDSAVYAIADTLWDTFHNVADRGVNFKTPAVFASGRVGSKWRVIAQVPFEAEQIK